MKTQILNILVIMMVLFTTSTHAFATRNDDGDITVSGVIKDARNGKRLSYVNISIEGTNIGTVANRDGGYRIIVPEGQSWKLVFSHLGYSNVYLTPDMVKKEGNNISMRESSLLLNEIVISGIQAREIVEKALDKVDVNFSGTNDMLTLFYRETVQKGKRYISVTEGVMDVYKTPYKKRNTGFDKVHPLKGRRLVSQRMSDTLAVKIVGGPYLAVDMDMAKNPNFLLDKDYLDDYFYVLEDNVYFGDRPQYVVAFSPAREQPYALFQGKLYIDCESMSFTRAEMEIDMSDKDKVTKVMLRKKPVGLRFNPQGIALTISYKQVDGVSYLNHIENMLSFKCDWKKRLFNSAYTARAEMVVTEREADTKRTIPSDESFRSRQVFSDLVDDYGDENFWKEYNIIEPTESLEHAVDKLKKDTSKAKNKKQ